MEEELSLYEATAEEQMQNAITHLDETLSHIRAGKASPKLLDTIRIDYYGTLSPLSSVATVHHRYPAVGKEAHRRDRESHYQL